MHSADSNPFPPSCWPTPTPSRPRTTPLPPPPSPHIQGLQALDVEVQGPPGEVQACGRHAAPDHGLQGVSIMGGRAHAANQLGGCVKREGRRQGKGAGLRRRLPDQLLLCRAASTSPCCSLGHCIWWASHSFRGATPAAVPPTPCNWWVYGAAGAPCPPPPPPGSKPRPLRPYETHLPWLDPPVNLSHPGSSGVMTSPRSSDWKKCDLVLPNCFGPRRGMVPAPLLYVDWAFAAGLLLLLLLGAQRRLPASHYLGKSRDPAGAAAAAAVTPAGQAAITIGVCAQGFVQSDEQLERRRPGASNCAC
jgi:hypothetical protein